MTLGSLFDGSGTCPLAATMVGMEPVWASEIEPYPIKVTSTMFPNMKHLGDIFKINGGEIPPVDVITFGSPCQNLSVAGNRKGLKGERSSLFFEAIRIIEEMLHATDGKYPRYALWENVPGAFTSNKGDDFRAVLQSFCDIGSGGLDTVSRPEKWSRAGCIMGDGYSVAWRTLDAQFWGVPQRRRRLFAVLYLGDGGGAGEILFKREGLSRDYKQSRTAREEAAGRTVYCALYSNHPMDSRVTEANGTCETLTNWMGTGGAIPR